MKRKSLLFLITSLVILSCGREEIVQSPLEGAWNLIDWDAYRADTLYGSYGKDITGGEIKIFSEKYFVFRGRYQADTTISNNFGGGSYILDGNHYEETYLNFLDLASPPLSVLKLLVEFKGDTLIQSWPCDDNWNLQTNYQTQKLVRLD